MRDGGAAGNARQAWALVAASGKRGFTVVDASAALCIAERRGSACVALDEDLRGPGFDVLPMRGGHAEQE
jgi:hypothetical protein